MSALDGLSHEEVAGRLDTTVETTRSLLARARENLRRTAAARETACVSVCDALDEAAAGGVRASEIARRHLWTCARLPRATSATCARRPRRLRRLASLEPVGHRRAAARRRRRRDRAEGRGRRVLRARRRRRRGRRAGDRRALAPPAGDRGRGAGAGRARGRVARPSVRRGPRRADPGGAGGTPSTTTVVAHVATPAPKRPGRARRRRPSGRRRVSAAPRRG